MKNAIKHMNAIFAVLILICGFLPYYSVSVSGYGRSDSSSENFFYFLDGDNDRIIWVILILLAIVVLAAASYIAQVKQYLGIINIASSAVIVIANFLTIPGDAIFSNSYGGVTSEASRGIGLWLMVIVAVVAVAFNVIKLLKLKGNPLFDAINSEE